MSEPRRCGIGHRAVPASRTVGVCMKAKRICKACSTLLVDGYWHCTKCRRSAMPSEVADRFELESRAAMLGVSPDALDVTHEEKSGGHLGPITVSTYTLKPGVTLDARQARAASVRKGTDSERIVGAALGWEREYWAAVPVSGRRGRRLDIALPGHRINVELDSLTHLDERDFDRLYDDALVANGWRVLRYWNWEALAELDRVRREARAAADQAHEAPARGDLNAALSWASSREMEDLVHPFAQHLASAFLPEVLPDGIIVYWLETGQGRAPAAYLMVPDARIHLTAVAGHLMRDRSWSRLRREIEGLPLYHVMAGNILSLRPAVRDYIVSLLAILDRRVLEPVAAYVSADDVERYEMICRTAMTYASNIVVKLGSSTVTVDAEVPTTDWTIGGMLRNVRQAVFLDGLTPASELRVRLRGPLETETRRPQWTQGGGARALVCNVVTNRATHLDAVRSHRRREATIWSGIVNSKWGLEHDPLPG